MRRLLSARLAPHVPSAALGAALLLLVAPSGARAQTATIHRDAWGAPHVLSDTDEGAVLGMAWALAEDDWPLIEENYLHALGRTAELEGEVGLADDWMARALEIVPRSVAEYEAASPRMRGLLDAFARGMNAWLEELPQVWNPSTGWLLNTNSTPFTATAGIEMERSDFPAYMVGDETDNPRARSSRRVLESTEEVTFEGFARAVWDSYLSASVPALVALSEEWERVEAGTIAPPPALERGTEEWRTMGRAIERLARWDRRADTASVETTWFVLMADRGGGASETVSGDEGAPMTAALAGALAALREEWGTVEVPWGRINRHQRPLPGGAPRQLDPDRPSLAVGGASGGLGSVFSYYSVPWGSAGSRLGVAGNSFVKVMEFGPAVRARSVLNYGQSGDPDSPHFFDQASLYVGRSFKPAHFTRQEVEANSVRSYVVGPEGTRPSGDFDAGGVADDGSGGGAGERFDGRTGRRP